ncbi:hypothetical protein BpHYR1_023145 [Brachionus plicatilis]|uniref:Uncharacterized protein n=1 Tax=Brachionus plicatilis TaxID=10195 RepID=A0A3M7S953_BRAPC|nr:hypothetical protein BpHYR1_023145 [Brachionus plicatilis]
MKILTIPNLCNTENLLNSAKTLQKMAKDKSQIKLGLSDMFKNKLGLVVANEGKFGGEKIDEIFKYFYEYLLQLIIVFTAFYGTKLFLLFS